MKIIRLIFYVISALVICEVTDIISLYRQDAGISFYSDFMENPLEEDESRELEEDDEYFLDFTTDTLYPIASLDFETPSLDFEMTEPLNEITVPPPQA